MTSPSHLRCIDCGAKYPTTEIRYRCTCGDLLEVRHDLNQIRDAHPDLRSVFDARRGAQMGVDASGVWRYREMILPEVPPAEVVTLGEGNTTLYHSPGLSAAFGGKNLYLKHEGENPTLSFKDRGMTAGVSWAQHLGVKHVVCASTGDTSAAMAAYAAHAEGMQAVVLLPHGKVTPEQLAQPIAYGATTLALDTDFDGCMAVVKTLSEQYPIYLLNSMNPFRIEGQKAIGIEACQQFGWESPDWIVVPVGNAGNISAIGKGLAEAHALGLIDRVPRLAGVQATAADPLFQSYTTGFETKVTVTAQATEASAIRIGDPVSRDKASAVIMRTGGAMASVSEAALMDAKARADRAGVAVCPNSGVALAGVRQLREDGTIGADERVVVVLTAHGLKFAQSGVRYHTGRMEGMMPEAENAPREIEASVEAVASALGLE